MCSTRFLAAIPRVLADVYHSLGTQLPEALLALLPDDFFSDESVSKDGASPSAPSASASIGSLASEDGNQLQKLRDRSANQRRRWVEQGVGVSWETEMVFSGFLCFCLAGVAC